MENENKKEKNQSGTTRRDVLKSLATVPVLGAFAYGYYKKKRYDHMLNTRLSKELGMDAESTKTTAPISSDSKQIRLGIIGFGIRGTQLMRAAGFVHPEWIDNVREAGEKNSADKRYAEYMAQENLNIVVNGVCDVFDVHAEKSLVAAANVERNGTDSPSQLQVKRPISSSFASA